MRAQPNGGQGCQPVDKRTGARISGVKISPYPDVLACAEVASRLQVDSQEGTTMHRRLPRLHNSVRLLFGILPPACKSRSQSFSTKAARMSTSRHT